MKITELLESKKIKHRVDSNYQPDWHNNVTKIDGGVTVTNSVENENKKDVEETWSQKYKKSIDCKRRVDGHTKSRSVHEARMNSLIENIMESLSSIGFHELEALTEINDNLDENLRKWFQQKWVRFGPDGKIRGACARGSNREGKPKCLPQSKAHALGKKGRATAARRKRRQDPNPERKGKAKNVATNESIARKLGDMCDISTNMPDADFWITRRGDINTIGRPLREFNKEQIGIKVTNPQMLDPKYLYYMMMHLYTQGYWRNNSNGALRLVHIRTDDVKNVAITVSESEYKSRILDEKCWPGYHKKGMKERFGKKVPNCVKNEDYPAACPHCGGELVSEEDLREKKDTCYYKVKRRYNVWPSAYASGALVQCRKKGAANWGKSKAKESISENFADGKGPGRPGRLGDSRHHGIPTGVVIAQLEKAAKASG